MRRSGRPADAFKVRLEARARGGERFVAARQARRGVASICIGGGEATAIAVEVM